MVLTERMRGKIERASSMPHKEAWEFLFGKKPPFSISEREAHPVLLADRIAQRTFRVLAEKARESALFYGDSMMETLTYSPRLKAGDSGFKRGCQQ